MSDPMNVNLFSFCQKNKKKTIEKWGEENCPHHQLQTCKKWEKRRKSNKKENLKEKWGGWKRERESEKERERIQSFFCVLVKGTEMTLHLSSWTQNNIGGERALSSKFRYIYSAIVWLSINFAEGCQMTNFLLSKIV